MQDDGKTFRRVMQQRADTVHLITYRSAAGRIEGMTATAVTALSLTPPSIIICINHGSRARDAIRSSGFFGVSILAAHQEAVSNDGAQVGGAKAFDAELTAESDPSRTPVLSTALATLQCKVVEDRDLFTHTVFVGEVLSAQSRNAGPPLLHHLGSYTSVGAKNPR